MQESRNLINDEVSSKGHRVCSVSCIQERRAKPHCRHVQCLDEGNVRVGGLQYVRQLGFGFTIWGSIMFSRVSLHNSFRQRRRLTQCNFVAM